MNDWPASRTSWEPQCDPLVFVHPDPVHLTRRYDASHTFIPRMILACCGSYPGVLYKYVLSSVTQRMTWPPLSPEPKGCDPPRFLSGTCDAIERYRKARGRPMDRVGGLRKALRRAPVQAAVAKRTRGSPSPRSRRGRSGARAVQRK